MRSLFRLLGFRSLPDETNIKEIHRRSNKLSEQFEVGDVASFKKDLEEQHEIVKFLIDQQDPVQYLGNASVRNQDSRLLYGFGVDSRHYLANDPLHLRLVSHVIGGILNGPSLPSEVHDSIVPYVAAGLEETQKVSAQVAEKQRSTRRGKTKQLSRTNTT